MCTAQQQGQKLPSISRVSDPFSLLVEDFSKKRQEEKGEGKHTSHLDIGSPGRRLHCAGSPDARSHDAVSPDARSCDVRSFDV